MSEKELWREFDKQRPVIFSAILDALVCALRELAKHKTQIRCRAWPTLRCWATAGETAFGFKRGTFIAGLHEESG